MKRKPILYVLSLLLISGSLSPVFSRAPESAKIVYTSETVNIKQKGNSDIYIMNPDGTGQIKLTRHPASDSQPVWSPTGDKILFTSNRDGISDLFLMNADGTNVQQVFQKLANRRHGTWAPDGKRIAYYRVDAQIENPGIYIATIDGGEEERIVSGWQPAWSPNGSEIVFISLEDLGIHTINLQTGVEDIVLPMEQAIPFDPVWSPDGTQIAFTGINLVQLVVGNFLKAGGKLPNAVETIYTVNRDGSQLEQVVFEDTKTSDPAWSPLGNQLVYEQSVGKEIHLFSITLGSDNPHQLTDEGYNRDPDWFDPLALPVAPQPKLFTTIWGKIKAD
ncbi:MAG: hypothetical protein OYL97_15760 [Candidatus Poribacteria bacterium]|nr:hypothetical protein [Candidatus Poribacteria bacterium]